MIASLGPEHTILILVEKAIRVPFFTLFDIVEIGKFGFPLSNVCLFYAEPFSVTKVIHCKNE